MILVLCSSRHWNKKIPSCEQKGTGEYYFLTLSRLPDLYLNLTRLCMFRFRNMQGQHTIGL